MHIMKRIKQRRRIKNLYAKVRPYVEEHCGPGSLTRKKFAELCRQGDALMRKAIIKRKMRDAMAEKLVQLERRVRRLEAQK